MRVGPSLRPSGWRWLALLPALGCVGCSGQAALHPVRGQVLQNERPAKGVVVTFHRQGDDPIRAVRPVGLTGPDGTFTLTTGDKEGAPAGEYRVTLIWPEEVAPKGKKGFSTEPPDSRDRLNGAYANADSSVLKVTIGPGENRLEPFRLK
jgi:hypothetical protein